MLPCALVNEQGMRFKDRGHICTCKQNYNLLGHTNVRPLNGGKKRNPTKAPG